MRTYLPLSSALFAATFLGACGGGGGDPVLVAPPGDVGFDPASPTALAENGVPLTLTVRLAEALGEDVAFSVQVDGTVEAGDVTVTPTQLLIAAGDLEVELTLTPNDDQVFEGDEVVLLALQQTAGAPLGLDQATFALDLLDDESAPTLSFQTAASTTSESTDSHSVLLTLSGPAEAPVAFGLDLGGTASLGADYAIDTSSLSFAPLELTRSLLITPVADEQDEGEETIVLTLQGLTVALLGDPAEHTVTLQDTPSSGGLAFTAQRLDGSRPLLVTDSAGAPAADLTGFIGTSNDARDLLPSGNGSQIAFRGTVDSMDGIFVVDAAGGAPVRVSPIPSGFHLFEGDFAWSFDSQFLAFRINLLGQTALYSVRANGEDLTELVTPVAGQIVPSFAWSPAANELAWSQGFQQGPAIVGSSLWTARADGLEAVQRSGPAGFVGVEDDFVWTPDGQRLYYRADNDSALRIDVFQVQLDGASAVLMTPFSAGSAFQLLPRPGTDDVAFLGRFLDAQTQELFVLEADGVAPVELSDPAVTGAVATAIWAPDGSRIAFIAFAGGGSLKSALPDGSDLQEIEPSVLGSDTVAWAPDSSAIAYRTSTAVFRSAPDGSDPTSIAAGEFGPGLYWSPDSTRIAASLSPSSSEPPRLVSIESATGLSTLVQDNLELEAFPGVPQWSPDSAFLAYVQDIGGVQELYVGTALADDDGQSVSGSGLASNGFWDFVWLD